MSHLDAAEAILETTGEGYRNDVHVIESVLRELIAHLREQETT